MPGAINAVPARSSCSAAEIHIIHTRTVALALLRVMAPLCTDGFTGLLFNVKEGKSGSEIILNLSERTIMTMSDSNWIHSSILFRLSENHACDDLSRLVNGSL